MIPAARAEAQSVVPGFGPEGSDTAILIPGTGLEVLTKKIVKGFTYLQTRRVIDEGHRIEWFVLRDEAGAPVEELISSFGSNYDRGPGLLIRFAMTGATNGPDPIASMSVIEIWSRLKIYASVNPAGEPEFD